jgi:lysozyme
LKTSQTGVDLIKSFEGVRYTAYLCPAGVLTIGYGHTGPDVKKDSRVDNQQAEILLRKDLVRFEDAVKRLVKIPLNQNQFDTLVSFSFNLGIGALEKSTLLKRLNAGENPCNVAKEELPKWNKADGKVLSGLTRRRLTEVDLFCQKAPELKKEKVDITAKVNTWLKKEPIPSSKLPSDAKANIYQSRTIRNCTVLDRKDNHTYLELGFGLGKWWIFDPHWNGLQTKPSVTPYAVDGNLRYLRDFPYFLQRDNGPEGWRQCQTSSIAMCLKYIDVPGIEDDTDYLKIVNKYGDTTKRDPHHLALKELNAYARFTASADEHTVKSEIDKGLPVVAGILHHGTVSKPAGGGHFIVITGYDRTHWLAQDPYGELDLVNGGWAKLSAEAGKNVRYSFKNLNPRLFYEGSANGWCWLNFRRK